MISASIERLNHREIHFDLYKLCIKPNQVRSFGDPVCPGASESEVKVGDNFILFLIIHNKGSITDNAHNQLFLGELSGRTQTYTNSKRLTALCCMTCLQRGSM